MLFAPWEPAIGAAFGVLIALAAGNPAPHDYRELNGLPLLWSARHLTWVGLHDRPFRLDPSLGQNPEELPAELLLEGHHLQGELDLP